MTEPRCRLARIRGRPLRHAIPTRELALGLLAAAAGAVLPLAFAPWSWWPLAPLSLAVIFRLAHRATPRRGFVYGYLFGVGLFGVGVSWVHVSLARFGGGGPVVAIAATAALIALLAVFPAVALAGARWLRPGIGAWGPLAAMPAAWVLLEWVRTWAFTGFPWLLLGYSQTDSPVGAAVAPVFGVLGTSALVALAAGALAWLADRPDRKRWGTVLGGGAAAGLLIFTGVDHPWTRPAGPPLDVALVQGNVGQAVKWQPENLADTLARYRELTEPLWGADLVVWPETALPVWYDRLPKPYVAGLANRARRTGTSLITGVPTRENGRAYNSALAVGSGAVYHKRHLVPFGEYVPLRSVFGNRLDVLGAPMSDFSPGSRPVLLPAAGYRAGIAICYEIAFGTEVAALLPDANVLINISNDAWFGDSIGPQQHLQIARMRAMELQRYLLRATNTGLTAIIDPHGRVTAQAPQFEATALREEVSPRTGLTPYARWTDAPILIGLMAVLGPLMARRVVRLLRCLMSGRRRLGQELTGPKPEHTE